MAENDKPSIVPVRIADEMRSSYMDYAMSVIVGRALPDVRDGLKPVHRRILYAMHQSSNTWNRAYKKSARTVGDVIGKYHPHGDSAVYDALVRMAQEFSMRMPLIDGQGNFGSVDGDPPAAMRYTEVRMTRATAELLADIEKDTVDFGLNYDESESEPLVLPARIPNLLVNGSEGIAVGMATRIPPHNPGEILRACIHLVNNPQATDAEIMAMVPGPDFPTGGILFGIDGVRDAYTTGRGVVRIRAVTHIETDERTGKDTIVVTELPYQVNKARLLEKIAELVREKAVEGITDLRDESDRTGMRMIIECRRDANSQVVLNQLFKKTALETSFGINMLAIVAGQPAVLSLRQILSHFIDFRRDVVTRRCIFELKEARSRMHLLDGLRKALDMIDAVIRTIRASKDADEACDGLMALLEVDEAQARHILAMRLQRLTNLEINKLLEEIGELQKQIDYLNTILSDERELMRVIRTELDEVESAYRSPRRTRILAISGEISLEDLIADEQEVVTLSHSGYIKRTQLNEYRTQKRGGKGLKGMETKEEDFVEDVWVTNTHASLLIFMSSGKCFRLKVHELPAGGRTSKGKPIVNLIPVDGKDTVRAVLPFDDFTSGGYIITATRLGLVKKTPLAAYRNINASGIIGVKVPDGDTLVAARLCGVADRILLASRMGKAITFDESDARPVGRNSQGVRGIALKKNDEMISMVVISREELIKAGIPVRDAVEAVSDTDGDGDGTELTDVAADIIIDSAASLEPQVDAVEGEDSEEPLEDNGARTILTITNAGYGKRTPISQYRVQNRGGGGIFTIRLSEKRGEVAGCRLVGDNEELILITNRGKLIRTHVKGISLLGRNTQGVRVISLEETERVVGIACFEVDDEEAVVTDANGEAVNPALVGEDAPAEDAVEVTPDDELRREEPDNAGDE